MVGERVTPYLGVGGGRRVGGGGRRTPANVRVGAGAGCWCPWAAVLGGRWSVAGCGRAAFGVDCRGMWECAGPRCDGRGIGVGVLGKVGGVAGGSRIDWSRFVCVSGSGGAVGVGGWRAAGAAWRWRK